MDGCVDFMDLKFRNLRLGARLSTLFIIFMVLIGAIVGLNNQGLYKLKIGMENAYDDGTLGLIDVGAFERNLFKIRVRLLTLLLDVTPQERDQLILQINDLDLDNARLWTSYLSTPIDADEARNIQAIQERLEEFNRFRSRFISLVVSGQMDSAKVLILTDGTQSFLALDEAVKTDIAVLKTVSDQEIRVAHHLFDKISTVNFVLPVLGALSALLLAWWIVHEIAQAFAALLADMKRLENGETAFVVDGVDRRDEVGDMARAIDVFRQNAIEKQQLEANERIMFLQREALQKSLTAEAEASSRFKSEFLANMSHEIRTPIAAIIGFTRVLKRSISDPAHLARLQKIGQASDHLLGVINDILDISKIEAGKMSINPEIFSLNHLLNGVRDILLSKAKENGLDFTVEVMEGVPDHLFGDPLRIRQCLINYVGNAIKFTHSGFVKICVSPNGETDAGPLIRFDVKDSGIGISADAIARLFSAFEQADKSTTRQFGGTGLGLALTKKFAEMMGGAVGVDSTVGAGSRFWFTAVLPPAVEGVPALMTSDEINESIQYLRQHFSGVRILVAEDTAVNREILLDMLADAGLTDVDVAKNGAEAVALATINAYRLILMDMQMPVMDGVLATGSIRVLPGYAHTPIIALTANAYDEARQSCINAGMNDFINKPIDPARLYALLIKWLGHDKEAAGTQPKPNPDGHLENDDADLLARLGAIEEIDLSKAPSAQRNPKRFSEYLLDYASTYRTCMEELRAALAAPDRDEARRLAHSLRGASSQLGIVGIQAAAETLENEIRRGEADPDVERRSKEIEVRLSAVCDRIERLRPQSG